MNKTQSLWTRGTLALVLGVGLSGMQLSAQETSPQAAPQPDQPAASQPTADPSQQPAPQTEPSAPQQSAPEQMGPHAQATTQKTDGQVFTGTVLKNGDKFVLQNTDGTTYDVDQQDMVKKYEGKQVRINGTLDSDGKTIHVK